MTRIEITVEQLRGMIGQEVCYEGIACSVIEVLEDGPSLVLEDREAHRAVQEDKYGDPNRWVTQTYTVPVLTPARDGLHPSFLSLDLLD